MNTWGAQAFLRREEVTLLKKPVLHKKTAAELVIGSRWAQGLIMPFFGSKKEM